MNVPESHVEEEVLPSADIASPADSGRTLSQEEIDALFAAAAG